MELNLGCGSDPWGDVRVDLGYRTQTGVKTRLNLRADAHYLPFRDSSFKQVRCWHMLEHVRNPEAVLQEIRRVSLHASLRFPLGDGYKREVVRGICNLSLTQCLHAARTRTRRAHLWIIRPRGQAQVGRYEIFCFFKGGRKGRFLRRLKLPTIAVEWRVDW
ncbi:methyltransferase domain-containing protein [Candidatus Bathyarchaeota archaeon]|nr:methyltransferase domain-containing protein [Candidatus Bathyarchaeota archaeon]